MRLLNCTLSNFKTRVIEKSIICFGAGKLFEDMFITMDETFLAKIEYVVDTYREMQTLMINGHAIRVVDYDFLQCLDVNNCVFLITSMSCYSIYLHLANIFEKDEIDCYVYPAMSLTSDSQVTLIEKNSKITIPKVIHYCWFGRKPIPEKNQHCIDSWRRICPDYEIVQWDEENYDIRKNQYMYDAYVHKKWGFVPDYARLDIIYKYGGIYLDTDVEMINKPDGLLGYDGFFGFQRNFWINLGVGFGAKKGNKYILRMLNEYSKYSFIKEDGSLNLIASPYYQTSFWIKQGVKCNNELQKLDNNIFLPTDFLDPQGYTGGKIRQTINTVSVHHYDESWLGVKEKQDNRMRYDELSRMFDLFCI